MKIYRIAVEYTIVGTITVSANNLKSALEKAEHR